MRTLRSDFIGLLTGRAGTFGASDGVGRVFMACRKPGCGRVVPYWNLVIAKRERGQRAGCKCGGGDVSPMHIPEWKAAWWVLVRGLLIRSLLFRKTNWDPRMPSQMSEHATS